MRSLEDSRARWKTALPDRSDLPGLRAAISSPTSAPGGQHPCSDGLRSVCWKVFLLFRSLDDTKAWRKALADSRSAYTSLKEHFTRNLDNKDDISADDPLSDNSETSPWNILRQDEDLRAEIFQDVERCMPEYTIFREPGTQSKLLEILFVYCKLNRDIGYRQGMHEVLAPILWVVYCDAIEGSRKTTIDDEMICDVLDARYIEHDAFTLFGAVMQTVKTFYETGGTSDISATGTLTNSPIVERSKRIHENYLHHADPELAEHLTAIEILPQIFLIRWIRLLFGREFPFEQVLALWDVLFAEDPGLELIDLISVSMLLRIRWQLLEADYTAALSLLLRYPVPEAPHGPSTFVNDALYLRHNLLLDGGAHLISKYSQKSPETTVTRKLPKKIKRARTAEQKAAQDAAADTSKPNKSILEQGSLEGMLQQAARDMYSRGEKWGVAKALRGAVQGLQSVNASPQTRQSPRQTPMRGGTSHADMMNRIEAMERRNKALSKMLEKAIQELWSCSSDSDKHKEPSKTTNDTSTSEKTKDEEAGGLDGGLSLAIAKVQFVQVYLEHASMPLPTDDEEDTAEREASSSVDSADGQSDDLLGSTMAVTSSTPIPSRSKPRRNDSRRAVPSTPEATSQRTDLSSQLTEASNGSIVGGTSPQSRPSSLSTPRPSLSGSAYSWMLGDGSDTNTPDGGGKSKKGGFVVTPSRSNDESLGKNSSTGDTKHGARGSDNNGSLLFTVSTDEKKNSDGDKEDEDDDVFGLGLRGGLRSSGRRVSAQKS